MKAFLAILTILGIFLGCQHHKHKHRHTKNFYHEVHNHPKEDISKNNFTIEQDIDLHLEELPPKS